MFVFISNQRNANENEITFFTYRNGTEKENDAQREKSKHPISCSRSLTSPGGNLQIYMETYNVGFTSKNLF